MGTKLVHKHWFTSPGICRSSMSWYAASLCAAGHLASCQDHLNCAHYTNGLVAMLHGQRWVGNTVIAWPCSHRVAHSSLPMQHGPRGRLCSVSSSNGPHSSPQCRCRMGSDSYDAVQGLRESEWLL